MSKIKSGRKSGKSWLTRGIRTSSKNLRSLHMIRKFTSCPHFHKYFHKYRSLYRKLIKAAKESYYSNRLRGSANSHKECWSIINDIRRKNNHRPFQIPEASPDTLNEYYCGIATKLQDKLNQELDPLEYLKDLTVPNSFFFHPTDLEELKKTVLSIKNKNSSGEDGLSARVFLNLPEVALITLVQIINNSWENGFFSPSLKTAKVIPIYKEGTLKDPSNFRPISLSSTLSKIKKNL